MNLLSSFRSKWFGPCGICTGWLASKINAHIVASFFKSSTYSPKPLPAHLLSKVDELNISGFCSINVSDLPLAENIITLLNSVDSSDLLLEASSTSAKSFWVDLLQSNHNHKYIYLSLAEAVFKTSLLDIAYAYTGRIPILENIFYMYSAFRQRPEFSGSQNWHLDRDQFRRLKVLWSPVHQSLNNGPTLIIPETPAHFIRQWENYPDSICDNKLFEILDIGENAILPLICKPDMFWLVDTSRLLHCGSRTKSAARTQMFIEIGTYYSRQHPINSLTRFRRSATLFSATQYLL
jgi:hypothetical protein